MDTANLSDADVVQKFAATETPCTLPERRAEQRCRIGNKVIIAFYNNGKLYRGALVNLTTDGACFLLTTQSAAELPVLSKGRNMECYVTFPYGRSKCRGTVQWKRQNGCTLLWGLSFFELSPDKKDPFRITISECCCRKRIPISGMSSS
jgi:hypothetical protein